MVCADATIIHENGVKRKIPCWYCRKGHTLISLLPDFLYSRLPGTLKEVEEVIEAQKHPSLESASEAIRPDIELPGALRWLRRRLHYVIDILTIARGILPQFGFKNLQQLQQAFKVDFVLPRLRQILEKQLSAKISRHLSLLRAHGLIRKLPRQHRYQLTLKGVKLTNMLNAILSASTENLLEIAA